ncbi:hypothetical protein BH11PSE12_BH11PSE12_34520 [soil metagenome]
MGNKRNRERSLRIKTTDSLRIDCEVVAAVGGSGARRLDRRSASTARGG